MKPVQLGLNARILHVRKALGEEVFSCLGQRTLLDEASDGVHDPLGQALFGLPRRRTTRLHATRCPRGFQGGLVPEQLHVPYLPEA